MSSVNLFNTSAFHWWIGIVESHYGEGGKKDPLNLNRAKVRIFGYHTLNKNEMPTENLPWALPLAPLNNPMGVKSPPAGEWVFGFFIDGALAQQPVMIGVIPGWRNKNAIDAPQLTNYPNVKV